MWSNPMVAVAMKAHARSVEQRGVAARAGADDQRIGVAHVAGCDLPAREAARLGIGFENPFEERNGAIDDDFHFDSFSMFGAKVTVFG